MVLAGRAGGVVRSHTPLRHVIARVGSEDGGSQALEFAMVLPLFGMLIALLVQTGLLLADVVAAQGIAREVVRTAVVEDRSAAREVGRDLAGRRDVRIEFVSRSQTTKLSDADDLVEARVELRSNVFASTGIDVWLPARAAMRPEGAMAEDADDGP
jgi:Flp pilus assembly protein TadG